MNDNTLADFLASMAQLSGLIPSPPKKASPKPAPKKSRQRAAKPAKTAKSPKTSSAAGKSSKTPKEQRKTKKTTKKSSFGSLKDTACTRPWTKNVPRVLMRALYVQTADAWVGIKNEHIIVWKEQEILLELPLCNIDQVYLFGNVQVTTGAIRLFLRQQIPLHYLTRTGRYDGVLRSPTDTNWEIVGRQYLLRNNVQQRLDFAKSIVAGKIRNSIAFLSQHARNHNENISLPELLRKLKQIEDIVPGALSREQLFGMEGRAAALYFQAFASCIRSDDFAFPGREQHPSRDPINALLSLGYTILTHRIEACMATRGIDSRIGLLHESTRYPGLACDMIEEFRAPLVDGLVLRLVNQGMLKPEDFLWGESDDEDDEQNACMLTPGGRKKFLAAFESRLDQYHIHSDVNEEVDWRRIIDLQVCRLKSFLTGQVSEYIPIQIK
ncbi:MAG: CRISPR-associated endonuclease Cas1 [Planctomycetia bacterium]|nr:CRISPR-associated endonuclease Cas1 [Planctomycetia bacterium]